MSKYDLREYDFNLKAAILAKGLSKKGARGFQAQVDTLQQLKNQRKSREGKNQPIADVGGG